MATTGPRCARAAIPPHRASEFWDARLGVNLCFAVKRMHDPLEWAAFVADDLGLTDVQFTFDLLDPWAPSSERTRVAHRVRAAADGNGLTLHNAVVGLAHYVPGGLLDPDPDVRRAAATWWRRAVDVAADLGVRAGGGPLGSMTARQATDPQRTAERWEDLVAATTSIADYAVQSGIGTFLIEPTPIHREVPSTIAECQRLLADMAARGAAGAGILLDTSTSRSTGRRRRSVIGHRRLDRRSKQCAWTNTDRRSDPHWGWPHEYGTVEVPELLADLQRAGLIDVPMMLEVFPRFEDDDEAVRTVMRATVDHCQAALAAAGAPGVSTAPAARPAPHR
ncbi:TIM barrel protein [Actinomadura sp. KC06]|uniref:sugar phosphate isomerase/epimerase family protein n=1 Tax=Actinomadura sp. KC06 TaxID=2530369 RepID=UPI001A9CE60A|nr:TIM barrel protein [Actinomadura sp. KC06]